MTKLTPRVTPADTLREIEALLDEFIDEKGIVVKFPGTVQQKVVAVLEYSDDLEEALTKIEETYPELTDPDDDDNSIIIIPKM